MNQGELFEAATPTVENVYLACPTCAKEWWAAIIVESDRKHGASADVVAGRCYCPSCQQPPPMRVARSEWA